MNRSRQVNEKKTGGVYKVTTAKTNSGGQCRNADGDRVTLGSNLGYGGFSTPLSSRPEICVLSLRSVEFCIRTNVPAKKGGTRAGFAQACEEVYRRVYPLLRLGFEG